MRRLYFIADTHFGHAEIIKTFQRPFSGPDEMTETLIENWNEVVGQNDLIYHLGDFGLWLRVDLSGIFRRLHGHKILIRGNHDNEETLALPWTDAAKGLMITAQSQDIWLSHNPQTSWEGCEQGAWHLYGHVHGRGRRNGLSLDAGVDCWDFRPVGFAEIRERMKLLALYQDRKIQKGQG